MTAEEINKILVDFIRQKLSPQEPERNYISSKYRELEGFLDHSCFQSGSYARFTANTPVHDLDVIWSTEDRDITDNPRSVLEVLAQDLKEKYKNFSKVQPEISIQDHSITLVFPDAKNEFSIDVVPGISQSKDENSIYLVPEIQKMSRKKRFDYYANPAGLGSWVLSDPKGYVKAASDLDSLTQSRFRKVAKFVKSWRHKYKKQYGDELVLKSFHLELIVTEYVSANPDATVLEGIEGSFELLPQRLSTPFYKDRADNSVYVDEYISKMTQSQRNLILKLQSEAYAIISKLSSAETQDELLDMLESIVFLKISTFNVTSSPITTKPHQPWGY